MSSIKNCMLCGSVANISEVAIDRYIAEEKFDGERIVAIKNGDNINLVNRRGANKENVYIEITESLKKFDFDFVIDGEIVAEKGVFNDLQRRALLRDVEEIKKRAVEIPTKFMAFDIISLKGEDLKSKPLLDRKKILSDNIKDNDRVVACEWISGEDNIKDLWEKIREENKEGIILKIKNSIYQNKRTNAWVKLKVWKDIDLKMNRYTINNAGIRLENNEGIFVQCAGEQAKYVKQQIDEKGEIMVTIQYLERTADNKFRFPSFIKVVENEEN
jgi:ATP-dependent DNA ligase